MDFEVLEQIVKIEPIAIGHGIRELQNLKRLFGDAHWRKLKGEARIKLPSGHVRLAEIHWYEPHGIGRRKLKSKEPRSKLRGISEVVVVLLNVAAVYDRRTYLPSSEVAVDLRATVQKRPRARRSRATIQAEASFGELDSRD